MDCQEADPGKTYFLVASSKRSALLSLIVTKTPVPDISPPPAPALVYADFSGRLRDGRCRVTSSPLPLSRKKSAISRCNGQRGYGVLLPFPCLLLLLPVPLLLLLLLLLPLLVGALLVEPRRDPDRLLERREEFGVGEMLPPFDDDDDDAEDDEEEGEQGEQTSVVETGFKHARQQQKPPMVAESIIASDCVLRFFEGLDPREESVSSMGFCLYVMSMSAGSSGVSSATSICSPGRTSTQSNSANVGTSISDAEAPSPDPPVPRSLDPIPSPSMFMRLPWIDRSASTDEGGRVIRLGGREGGRDRGGWRGTHTHRETER